MHLIMHYYVLKTYEGFFKKRHVGNTHFLCIPISNREFITVVLLGEATGTDNKWIVAQITRAPLQFLQPMLDDMKKQLGEDAFINIESIAVKPKEASKGLYNITLLQKGVYIKSNFTLEFEPEFSTDGRNLYSMEGNFDFYTVDMNMRTAKMQAAKAVAKFSRLSQRG